MWILGLLGTVAGAVAAPTYLRCDFEASGTAWTVDVAADELNQQITVGRQGRPPVTIPALFDPSKIVASEEVGQETRTWTISRVDLTIREAVSFSAHISNGTCKVKPAPAKRAF